MGQSRLNNYNYMLKTTPVSQKLLYGIYSTHTHTHTHTYFPQIVRNIHKVPYPRGHCQYTKSTSTQDQTSWLRPAQNKIEGNKASLKPTLLPLPCSLCCQVSPPPTRLRYHSPFYKHLRNLPCVWFLQQNTINVQKGLSPPRQMSRQKKTLDWERDYENSHSSCTASSLRTDSEALSQ